MPSIVIQALGGTNKRLGFYWRSQLQERKRHRKGLHLNESLSPAAEPHLPKQPVRYT